ncbi:hypothetical protein QA641_00340 [Bradyrhizobium sp. CB1650]|uniref:hypothetical protein n=1 Tax=Bradyrhizobium sp. CB1650 TaxID=3039153 RepID=UPI00243601B7|nr:hypothetical protein [Bradyrhizobium sp. CB1650]WGD52440.1 hypothetical protein QA641_00340 [Bradyrhizobium sp. CB1650]
MTIELVPGGFEPMRRTIGSIRISNETDLAKVSNYRIVAQEAANRLTGDPAGIAECMVRDHPRQQRVWALLQKACEELMKADFVEL